MHAKKKDVDETCTPLPHGSAHAFSDVVSLEKAGGHERRDIKKGRELMSDFCMGDRGGWRCKQDGPFRYKKLKQVRSLDHVCSRHATIPCPDKLASSFHESEEDSKSTLTPSKQVREESEGWEVTRTTAVTRKSVVDSETTQIDVSRGGIDKFTTGPGFGMTFNGKGVGCEDRKEVSRKCGPPIEDESTPGMLNTERVRASSDQNQEAEGMYSSEREAGGGSRVVCVKQRRGSSVPEALQNHKGNLLITKRAEKWYSTRRSDASESDAHEDFLSTPQQKVLSALSERCREGGLRGGSDPIAEQECGGHAPGTY